MIDLLEVLEAAGIAVQDHRVPGRPNRILNPIGVMLHHDAAPRTTADLPSLRTAQVGRLTGPHPVKGPLYNILIGRAGTVAGITDGSANHSGAGNSAALLRLRRGERPQRPTTEDDHDHISNETIGVCIVNDGVGEPVTALMLGRVAEVVAALCRHFSIDPLTRVIAHREWSRRKIDPTFDMDAMRADIAKRLTPPPPPEEDDMPGFYIRLPSGAMAWCFNNGSSKLLMQSPDEANGHRAMMEAGLGRKLPAAVTVTEDAWASLVTVA